jgi:hypothetical protein
MFPAICRTVACVFALGGVSGWVLPEAVDAQQVQRVFLEVRVLDARTELPIPGVTVVVLDTSGDRVASRVSDDDGRLSVEVRRRAAVRMRAGRIGYRTITTPLLDFGRDDYFVLDLRLDPEAIALAPLEVVARENRLTRSHVLAGFDERVLRGMGSYFTRSDIERLRPQRVTDLFRQLPGVTVVTSGRGSEATLQMNRTPVGRGGGPCQVQIYLDGMLVTRGGAGSISVDALVSPENVEGIEVYRGISTVPPEFYNSNAHCGVVALWSRRTPPGTPPGE